MKLRFASGRIKHLKIFDNSKTVKVGQNASWVSRTVHHHLTTLEMIVVSWLLPQNVLVRATRSETLPCFFTSLLQLCSTVRNDLSLACFFYIFAVCTDIILHINDMNMVKSRDRTDPMRYWYQCLIMAWDVHWVSDLNHRSLLQIQKNHHVCSIMPIALKAWRVSEIPTLY